MAGRGRVPKPPAERHGTEAPQLGEWKPAPGVGWQHGPIPAPPDGLVAASRDAWDTWFKAWWASHWTPADLPGLRVVIAQYDAVQRGGVKANDMTALVRLMDTYGITPAGQQARRWMPPKPEGESKPAARAKPPSSRYAHLKVIEEAS